MTKISLIAIIWVWHCAAYGQLSVYNNPYCIPYISTFVTQPHNHQNYDETVDQLLEKSSPFQGAIFVKMKKLEAITANLAKQLKDTIAKLDKNVSDLKDQLKTNIATKDDLAKKADQSELDKTNTELQKNSNNLETATKNFASTSAALDGTISDVAELTKMLNDRTSEIVDIGRMPTSCSDLKTMGHKLSGFFSVKGSEKMEMIYCDFFPNQNDKQKWIGYADVKSTPVYFYVQRSSFTKISGIITFDLALVNEGNAMDLTTGIFTAPRPGIYFFSFSALAQFPASSSRLYLAVGLYLNGNLIGMSKVEEANTGANQVNPLRIQSTLNLKKGDRVLVLINSILPGVFLFDSSSDHYTQFTGFMLEEEIVASL